MRSCCDSWFGVMVNASQLQNNHTSLKADSTRCSRFNRHATNVGILDKVLIDSFVLRASKQIP